LSTIVAVLRLAENGDY